MLDKIKFVLLKVIGVVITLATLNVILIIFFPEVYSDQQFSITLILINLFFVLDKIFQPFFFHRGKKDQNPRKTIFFILFIFAIPFLFTVPYIEYSFILKTILPPEATLVFWVLGTIMIIIGGITLVMGRYILGAYSSVKIGIEKDHKLITKGPYHVIRHPIYAGVLFLLLGYSLSFSSIVSSIIIMIVLWKVGMGRMELEEKLMIQTFGDEYLNYMKHTKRLIPYIY